MRRASKCGHAKWKMFSTSAVREAAVVGVMDPYRGETVKAFVSFKDGAEATTEDCLVLQGKACSIQDSTTSSRWTNDLPKNSEWQDSSS